MNLLKILLIAIFTAALSWSQALPPQHRIGVRVGTDGVGEFYDRTTNQTFTPRGGDYAHLADLPFVFGGHGMQHAVLVPQIYDPVQIDNALGQMSANGYNTVRVFLSPSCTTCMGNIQAPGLNSDYMNNVVDFLVRAKNHGIFVLLTTDFPPDAGGYLDPLAQADPMLFADANLRFLPAQGVQSDQMFWHDFVQYLVNANAPTDYILGYELRNELSFASNFPPLSLMVGLVTTANGLTYDMSSEAAKQQMLQDGLQFWMDSQTGVIKALDPTALVTTGFFEPQTPNPSRIGDSRLVVIYPAAANSAIDFVDLHPYPGINLTLQQYVENYGSFPFPQKPLLMGEFGAFQWVYPSAQQGANALRVWQAASCPLNFRGWLMWTWDEPDAQQAPQPLWNALDGMGEVNIALRPISRPNPCLPNNTVVSLSVSPNTPLIGGSVRLTASVAASNGGIPSGTVTFKDGSITLATLTIPTPSPIAALAVTNVSFATGGLHWITAAYSGDATNSPSTSVAVGSWVNALRQTACTPTLTVLSSPPFREAVEFGTPPQPISFRVGLRGSLYDGTQLIATSTSSTVAATLSFGQHSLTATCPAGKGINGSVSAPISLYVFR